MSAEKYTALSTELVKAKLQILYMSTNQSTDLCLSWVGTYQFGARKAGMMALICIQTWWK